MVRTGIHHVPVKVLTSKCRQGLVLYQTQLYESLQNLRHVLCNLIHRMLKSIDAFHFHSVLQRQGVGDQWNVGEKKEVRKGDSEGQEEG